MSTRERGSTLSQSGTSQSVSRKYRNMSPSESVQKFRNKWQLVNRVVDNFLTEVEENDYLEQDEIYPTVPLTILSIGSGIFGFQPGSSMIEHEALTSEGAQFSALRSKELADSLR